MVCKPWRVHPWPGHPSSHSANSIKTLSTCRCARKIRRDHPAFVAYWYYVPTSLRPGSARARAHTRLCVHALESPFRGCLPPWSNAPVDRALVLFLFFFIFSPPPFLLFPLSSPFFFSLPVSPRFCFRLFASRGQKARARMSVSWIFVFGKRAVFEGMRTFSLLVVSMISLYVGLFFSTFLYSSSSHHAAVYFQALDWESFLARAEKRENLGRRIVRDTVIAAFVYSIKISELKDRSLFIWTWERGLNETLFLLRIRTAFNAYIHLFLPCT